MLQYLSWSINSFGSILQTRHMDTQINRCMDTVTYVLSVPRLQACQTMWDNELFMWLVHPRIKELLWFSIQFCKFNNIDKVEQFTHFQEHIFDQYVYKCNEVISHRGCHIKWSIPVHVYLNIQILCNILILFINTHDHAFLFPGYFCGMHNIYLYSDSR